MWDVVAEFKMKECEVALFFQGQGEKLCWKLKINFKYFIILRITLRAIGKQIIEECRKYGNLLTHY